MHQIVVLVVSRREFAKYVFHHHHRAVHQNAEVDRPNGQQVGGNVAQIQADERKHQGERNRAIATMIAVRTLNKKIPRITSTRIIPRIMFRSTVCVVSSINVLRS